MQTLCTFKSSILGDPRLLLLGATAYEESIGTRKLSNDGSVLDEGEREVHSYAQMDSETKKSYNCLAQMMENKDMEAIMAVFVEKILMNLVHSLPDEEDSNRLVDTTLDVLQFYTGAISSCRMIAQTPVMQQLITNGVQHFQLLTHQS